MPALAQKTNCTGCTACASVCPERCIAMTEDKEGFLTPCIDEEKCISCDICEKVCPVITPLKCVQPVPKAYAAYSKDETIRRESSSGGIFTEIAKTVLADGGVVFGAAYSEGFKVVHICAETEEGLRNLRGAKYAQSDLTDVFIDIKNRLTRGQKVLFSGTPCQVGGLKAYLGKEYEKLLTVDFVCLSVPSPMAWQKYLVYRAALDNKSGLPIAVNLRSKKAGWSRYQYSNLFEYADGTLTAAKSGESLYMKLFVGGYISREACRHCQFKGYSRVSDLTLGDFWGIWDIAPEMDDDQGTSVVLVQSAQGSEVLDQISSHLILKEMTLEETSRQNPAMVECARFHTMRGRALGLISEDRIAECDTWFEPEKDSLLQRVRSFVGRALRRSVK